MECSLRVARVRAEGGGDALGGGLTGRAPDVGRGLTLGLRGLASYKEYRRNELRWRIFGAAGGLGIAKAPLVTLMLPDLTWKN